MFTVEKSGPRNWTVNYKDPTVKWAFYQDIATRDQARKLAAYLNKKTVQAKGERKKELNPCSP